MVSFPQILSSPLIFPLTLLTTIPLLILLAISQSLFRWHHIFQKKYPPDLCCTLLDVYKLFSSKDTLTRRTGWSLFLAAYSLFLVDLFLWRFPQPEMASPLLQVEQVGSETICVLQSHHVSAFNEPQFFCGRWNRVFGGWKLAKAAWEGRLPRCSELLLRFTLLADHVSDHKA